MPTTDKVIEITEDEATNALSLINTESDRLNRQIILAEARGNFNMADGLKQHLLSVSSLIKKLKKVVE